MLKLQSLLFVVCVALLPSCDGTETADSDVSIQVSVETLEEERSRRPNRSRSALADVLTRADAAFAELGVPRPVRFDSRIGPQPWPTDLPNRWPTPSQARVVAVAMQREGNRLLLIDLPGSARESLAHYRNALRAEGYRVARRESRRSTHALRVKSGEDEVVLTFFGRKHGTRLEILFVGSGWQVAEKLRTE
jgi:hypothetical protein